MAKFKIKENGEITVLKHLRLIELLTEIAEKKGPYSQNHLTHAENCIEAMSNHAKECLELLKE